MFLFGTELSKSFTLPPLTQTRIPWQLAIFRNYSLRLDIPVWNYFYVTPMFGLGDPSEGQLAWQM